MDAHHIPFLSLFDGPVQYVVPRWQRRYRWGESDIARLVDDLVTISAARDGAAHYGGTLLTFPEPGAAGMVKTIRVIDGQQRLTTVSILLACIADALGDDQCREWSARVIHDYRLTNPGMEKLRKLRLQKGDEEEYRSGLDGSPSGVGAVTQAWRVVRRLITKHDLATLLTGLERLRVVSIGLASHDDPQQIFESINATGRPLTESEKVKNWLLMGLADKQQQELYDRHWTAIERHLGAKHTTDPIDMFLRDLLRWKTGEVHGRDRVYEGLRRWAVRHGLGDDRPALCRELARLAALYGMLTDAHQAPHRDKGVERELRYLRAMGLDAHRPFALRILDDASGDGDARLTDGQAAQVLAGVATWTTRLWLADQPTAGLNRAVPELAHGPGPGDHEDPVEHWLGRIRGHRNTRVGVPDDDVVRAGIRTRKAYGGSGTRSSKAVLCALMEHEHREESPALEQLTVEHVMPQKLTDDWRRAMGDEADEIHGQYRDTLPNLTLSGDATNSSMAARTFHEKREAYRKSTIGMTRRLASYDHWNEDSLADRAEWIAHRILERWPWHDGARRARSDGEITPGDAPLKWRIEEGPWRPEHTASQMVLHVASALLSRNAGNAERLSGEAASSNIHPASRYPAGTKAGTLTMRAVPGHEQYVLYPYTQDWRRAAERCQSMGERCSVRIDVERPQTGVARAFWRFFLKHTGGVPGQTDAWIGPSQWTSLVTSAGDRIGMNAGEDVIRLYARAGQSRASAERNARMQRYSQAIRDQMGDQEIGVNVQASAESGRSVNIRRRWTRDDEGEWPEAAQWIKEQHERLREILIDCEGSATGLEVPDTERDGQTSEMTDEERRRRAAERFVAPAGSVRVIGRYDPETKTVRPFTEAEIEARDRVSRAIEAERAAREREEDGNA